MDYTLILFELVYVFNLVGSLILISNVQSKRHTEGMSFYTQLIYALAAYVKFFYFYFSVLSGYWLFWLESLLSVAVNSYLVYLMIKHKRISLTREQNFFDYRAIIVVSIVLAVLSNLERSRTSFEWHFFAIRLSNFLECLGVLPQLRLMRTEKFVTKPIGYFLISLMISRIFRIVFWINLFNFYYSRESYYLMIGADVVYIILLLDLAYFFFKYRNAQVIPYN